MNEYGFDFAIRARYPMPEEIGNIRIVNKNSRQVYNETLGFK